MDPPPVTPNAILYKMVLPFTPFTKIRYDHRRRRIVDRRRNERGALSPCIHMSQQKIMNENYAAFVLYYIPPSPLSSINKSRL